MKVVSGLLVWTLLCVFELKAEPPRPQYGVPSIGGGGGGYASGRPGVSLVGGGGGGSLGGGGGYDLAEPANYNFAYEVKDAPSGNDFGHMESRVGEVAKGSYHVLLPDGRMQRVDYTADATGYHPVVTYIGEAKFGPGVGGGKVVVGGGGGGGVISGGGGIGGGGQGYIY